MLESLTWHDAIAQTGIAISHEEAAQGWPCDMFVWRVAQLQRDEQASRIALHWALSAAVNDGSVPSVQRVLRLEISGRRRDIHGNVYGAAAPVPEVRDVPERYVTASAVVAWLEKAGEKPSQHIAAWHRATSALGRWQQLIAERNQSEGFKWTAEHAQTIKAEEERRSAAPGAKGVRKAMADEMAISPQKLFDAMRKHLPSAPGGRPKRR